MNMVCIKRLKCNGSLGVYAEIFNILEIWEGAFQNVYFWVDILSNSF